MKCFLQFTTAGVALALLIVACGPQADYSSRDFRLAQAVRDRFAASPDTKGATSRIRVEAKDGVVTLSGTVDTTADKTLAGQVAGNTIGVKSLVDQVTVNVPVLPVPDEPFEEQKVRAEAASNGESIGASSEDARIYHAVRRQLVKNESTPKRSIFVDVENGDVTLRGKIFTTVARDEAVAAALKVNGVKAVRDRLVINSLIP
jgi:osmotically-inducible protein OsmY